MIRRLIYPSYASITGISRRTSRRVSERGQLIQIGIIVTAALGIDTEIALIYQLFAFLICLYAAARVATLFQRPRLSVRRALPRFVTAGEPFQYTVHIHNEGDRQEEDLILIDKPLVTPPSYNEFVNAREPGEEERNAYDRYVGFHRFVWLQRRKTGVTTEQLDLPPLPAMGDVHAKVTAEPLRRGRVVLSGLTVGHPDPFGLVYGFEEFDQPEQVLVLPKRYPLPVTYLPPGGRHYQPGGVTSAWSVGESDEFVSLRDYRDGDPLRRIHWPSTAKRDIPVVKEHQDEYFVRQALVLDTCSTDWELMEDAVSVAASFAVTVDTKDSLLDLMFVAEGPFHCTAGRGLAHAEQLLEVLSATDLSECPFETLSASVLHHAPFLSGTILVLIDWDEKRKQMIRGLRSLNIPLEILVIRRADQPPIEDEDLPDHFHILLHGEIAEGLAKL
jgi:uncharacterized protein (DUF58 family)|tara:strand:- start:611 stop:1945 length:1335 start_codon:yes stop_codon:yes gene_type:complete